MPEKTVPSDFAYRLRTARRHSGMSPAKLSSAMAIPRGASASTLKLYEKDKKLDALIAERFIDRLAAATHIPADYFWGDDTAFPASRGASGGAWHSDEPDIRVLIGDVAERLGALEAQQANLQTQVGQLVGVLTGNPEATASLSDAVVRVFEEAMSQRAEKVGLRGRTPPPPHQSSGTTHAA